MDDDFFEVLIQARHNQDVTEKGSKPGPHLSSPSSRSLGLPGCALCCRSAMWPLAAWALLSAVGAGSAQLMFNATDAVEINNRNKTVLLPCYVTNLKENNICVMFITWRKQGKKILSFDGARQKTSVTVTSVSLPPLADILKGNASLMLNSAEADVGNYSCEVTESNREGAIIVEIRNRSVISCSEESTSTPKEKCGLWFLLVERAIIIMLLFLAIILCSAQLSVIALKYEVVPKKMGLIVAGIIFTGTAAVVGIVVFFFSPDGYTAQNQAGLGLIIVPTVTLVPLQYFMFGIVFDSLSQASFALIGLQILDYIVAVVGFALCVSACPQLHGSVVIAGLAIMAIASLLSLAYVFIMGSRIKDHPHPGNCRTM
ncbi:LOW QUALITY PROTEIN: leukocyte surface antigen CD47-like [Chlamydotis macqueenii]